MGVSDSYKYFGDYFRQKRAESGLTLRQFCLQNGLDPGNISRIERGIAAPPQGKELLSKYAGYLNLKPETDEWYEFFDLAHAATGRIPDEIMEEAEFVKKLPLVFRTIRGQKVPDEKLDELIKRIKES
jgi:transcriptional regulator with XRE-family HTH domain